MKKSNNGPDEVNNEAVTEKAHFSWKRLLTTIALVIFTGVLVFGITWFFLDKMTRENDETSDKLRIELQRQLDGLRGDLKKSVTTAETISDLLKYTNDDYGYQLTFTNNWKGYEVKEVNNTDSGKTWYFGVPTTDSSFQKTTSTSSLGFVNLFAISAYTESQWQENQANDAGKSTYLGENSKYTFGYAHAQYGSESATLANADISMILKTFKVN
jgi:hypothetical protein